MLEYMAKQDLSWVCRGTYLFQDKSCLACVIYVFVCLNALCPSTVQPSKGLHVNSDMISMTIDNPKIFIAIFLRIEII